jgi:plastocyanin
MTGVSGFEFSSNNTSVATVSSTGLITAQAVGNATITVAVTHNGVPATGTSSVTVTSSGGTPSATVATTNSSFVPTSVTIGAGGSVTWQFGTTAHNVNFDAGGVTNIGTTSNASVSRMFPAAGNFTYHCNLHEGMTGTVVVN